MAAGKFDRGGVLQELRVSGVLGRGGCCPGELAPGGEEPVCPALGLWAEHPSDNPRQIPPVLVSWSLPPGALRPRREPLQRLPRLCSPGTPRLSLVLWAVTSCFWHEPWPLRRLGGPGSGDRKSKWPQRLGAPRWVTEREPARRGQMCWWERVSRFLPLLSPWLCLCPLGRHHSARWNSTYNRDIFRVIVRRYSGCPTKRNVAQCEDQSEL